MSHRCWQSGQFGHRSVPRLRPHHTLAQRPHPPIEGRAPTHCCITYMTTPSDMPHHRSGKTGHTKAGLEVCAAYILLLRFPGQTGIGANCPVVAHSTKPGIEVQASVPPGHGYLGAKAPGHSGTPEPRAKLVGSTKPYRGYSLVLGQNLKRLPNEASPKELPVILAVKDPVGPDLPVDPVDVSADSDSPGKEDHLDGRAVGPEPVDDVQNTPVAPILTDHDAFTGPLQAGEKGGKGSFQEIISPATGEGYRVRSNGTGHLELPCMPLPGAPAPSRPPKSGPDWPWMTVPPYAPHARPPTAT